MKDRFCNSAPQAEENFKKFARRVVITNSQSFTKKTVKSLYNNVKYVSLVVGMHLFEK
jgi:hypothetical protein